MTHQATAKSHWAVALAIGLSLAACSGDTNAPPEAVSKGEAQALEEAASMLDEQRPPLDAIAPSVDGPEGETTQDSADLTGDEAPQSSQ